MDLEDLTGVVASIQDFFDTHETITIEDVMAMMPVEENKNTLYLRAATLLRAINKMGCFQVRPRGKKLATNHRAKLMIYRKRG
jgi:glycine cleavage system regulatory protein